MRRLKVALVHTDTPRAMDMRSVGIWSYPVTQFRVEHFPQVDKYAMLATSDFDGFDFIWWEDHRCYVKWHRDSDIPIFYYVVDSTLSDDHLYNRLKSSEHADAIFVDWAPLDDFQERNPDKSVQRLSHCVNDLLFKDYGEEKTIDFGMHCHLKGPGGERRVNLIQWVTPWAEDMEYRFDFNKYGGEAYARAIGREKVTLQLNRNEQTRAHRTFDAMACRTCLLTEVLPDVSDEPHYPAQHYADFETFDEALIRLDDLLHSRQYKYYQDAGYEWVQENHTWAIRAQELYEKASIWLEQNNARTIY